MGWQAVFTLLTLVAVLSALAVTRISADLILMAALALLTIFGILQPAQALAGFGNPGVITIATLYIVAAGLKETGAVQWIARRLLGHPRNEKGAQFRMIAPTGLLSAFMNNTAVVAMFIPAIQEWAQRLGISASKLLLPLSYAAILGGTCTLIGTSTNLVVDGLLQTRLGIHLGLFDLAWVGVPLLIVGGFYLVFWGSRLLPDRGGFSEELDQVREYGVEVEVASPGPLVGKTIVEAGLRALKYGYLAEIDRAGRLITAVEPDRTLQPGDKLYFVGAPECASELRRIQGLKPANGSVHKLEVANHQRCLVEVVLGPEFPALGKTIRDSRFRTRFNAVILSVSREGKRVPGKLGDITFRMGDTLLLEASHQFVEQYRFRRDFLLVSALNDSTPPDFRKAPLALGILGVMVFLSATGLLQILEAAFLAAGAMILFGCITASRARRSIDLPVLVIIGASFALGNAMTETGAAQWLAGLLLGFGPLTPWFSLFVVYLLTALFTEVITNNAAAVLMFPIALAISDQLGVSPLPFAVAVMFAASASFVTPLGYQTNLMVYGPGRYQFADYVKIGLPLSFLVGAVAIALIPFIWSF
ncbi:TrkA domain-containing protein [Marinobacter santoriniensis NKSG1]|uniref:TrkA domain-containing protein n=1 Tax=Marinobacter santoriniensis NKSG1 TaxID=1288826 RepID=M7CS24_9GAMM|nr:SLC13 family permease [Marinobacter santoriniensis]EMP55959.1 TrkA domain-containing protein [Marinobacter santoriniensis NKSG1]